MDVEHDTRPPAICLLGPTACGKTDLAMRLQDVMPVEIISVDSAMIYRGMNIGTAKPDTATLARYPHRLIDIRDPADTYSVAEFLRDARREMTAIAETGRVPLLAGGTMLYFRALMEGLAELPTADPALRERLQVRADREGWPLLHAELKELDPDAAARIHPHHSQRILRALEVCLISGRPMSSLHRKALPVDLQPITSQFRVVQLGLLPTDRAALHRRIEGRFVSMLEQGLLDEVAALRQRGDLHAALPSIRCVGYRQTWGYLEGEYDRDEMIRRGVAATRQLAKRQLTWLRGWSDLQAIPVDLTGNSAEIINESCRLALKILRDAAIYNGAGPSYH